MKAARRAETVAAVEMDRNATPGEVLAPAFEARRRMTVARVDAAAISIQLAMLRHPCTGGDYVAKACRCGESTVVVCRDCGEAIRLLTEDESKPCVHARELLRGTVAA